MSQILTQKQSQQQEQALIQYYIYQDLQNLINLIQSRKAVLDYFQNDLNHPMVTSSNNKILLQLNLSNGIHFDQQKQYSKDKTLTDFLKEQRKKAYEILKQVIDNKDNLINKGDSLYQSLQTYKSKYQNSQFGLNEEYQLQPTQQDNKFDQNVLSKIISSIQTVDFDINQIQGYFPVPSQKEILQKANDYQNKAKQKLIENFPKNGKTKSQNGKTEFQNPVFIEEEMQKKENDKHRKAELINFLLLQGYFNEKKIQYNCYNLVQEQFNQIKDLLITSIQQTPELQFAKQLYKDNNKLEDEFKLFFFLELFQEYQECSRTIQDKEKIKIFRNSINDTKDKANHKQFFCYLKKCENFILQQNNHNLPEEKHFDQLFEIFCQYIY
ncbi:unnamed protein product [Paramecium pentaurelia]|uniref:Uncharacterized protein n=1 Tax=Paramecium pentaurelia TaxID=43138 RepID=A0A8S1X2R6_9CILI|nr:unnamed protein product [Paramecium pentaurelia]